MNIKSLQEPLTKSEKSDLQRYKAAITKLAHAYMECYPMLLEIRERRLYREEAGTFEEFCQKHWGFTRRWVNEVIGAGVAVQQLTKDLGTKVPNLAAARVLKKIKPERRVEAVKKAAKNGDSSAQALEDIRKQQEEEAGVVTHEETDIEGFPIPAHLVDFFHRRKEMDDLLHKTSTLATAIERMAKENDPLVAFVPQYVCDHLRAVYSSLKDSRPDILCWSCNGNDHKGCLDCAGTGFRSQWMGSQKKGEAKRQARLRKLKK